MFTSAIGKQFERGYISPDRGTLTPLTLVCESLDKNNEERLFVFDTEAYVLNDDGKTVEIVR